MSGAPSCRVSSHPARSVAFSNPCGKAWGPQGRCSFSTLKKLGQPGTARRCFFLGLCMIKLRPREKDKTRQKQSQQPYVFRGVSSFTKKNAPSCAAWHHPAPVQKRRHICSCTGCLGTCLACFPAR